MMTKKVKKKAGIPVPRRGVIPPPKAAPVPKPPKAARASSIPKTGRPVPPPREPAVPPESEAMAREAGLPPMPPQRAYRWQGVRLTLEWVEDFKAVLANLLYVDYASEYLGVGREVLRAWVKDGYHLGRQVTAGKVGLNELSDHERCLLALVAAFRQGVNKGIAERLLLLQIHARRDPRVIMWELEKKNKQRFGKGDRDERPQEGGPGVHIYLPHNGREAHPQVAHAALLGAQRQLEKSYQGGGRAPLVPPLPGHGLVQGAGEDVAAYTARILRAVEGAAEGKAP